MVIEVILLAFGLVLLAEVWRSHREQRRAIDARREVAPRKTYPSVTVIRPIKGLDAGAEQNLRAALETGYPGKVQTIFVFDDASEPAVPLAEKAIADHAAAGCHGSARVLFCGTPPRGRTGKLNAMIAGLRQASGELIVFADSDIRPGRNALRRLVETLLASPDTGSAFAPVVVTQPPRTVGDAGYTLLLNGLYGPAAAAAAARRGGELPFIMGQFMVFRREAIKAIGGLETAEGQLVDDMYLGKRVSEVGLRNRVSPHPVPIIQEGLPIGEFVRTFVRWITFSRSGLPGREFKLASWLRGSVFWIGLLAAAVAAWQGLWLAAALNALVPLATAESINILHETLGGAPLTLRHRWVSFAVLLTSPAIYLSVLTRRRVSWRGRSYDLNAEGRLAERPTGNLGEGATVGRAA
jgi:ceramide glucosyltransferase